MTLLMRNMVAKVLARPEVAKIEFSLGKISISSASFKKVGVCIRSGKIKVTHTPKLGRGTAKYRYTKNTLFLGFSSVSGNADSEALIVHECTHAACDIDGKKLLVSQSEAAAYVAQCLYYFYRNEVELSKPGVSPTFKSDLLREAWAAATKARASKALGDADIKPLIDEIEVHKLYKTRHSLMEAYDGV